MEKGSIMLDREASSLPQLVGKYVVLRSYHFFHLFLPIHEFPSMPMTSSISRVEYSRTFILSLFLCFKTNNVSCRKFGKYRHILRRTFKKSFIAPNILVYFYPVLFLNLLSYAFHFYVI